MFKRLFTFHKRGETPSEAKAFETVQQETGACDPKDRGIRSVDLARIAGSIGRYQDFDSYFQLKGHMPVDRLKRIKEAMRLGKPLEPIKLYQIKDAYYVLDGNHRVAAAKELGHDEILARVVELTPSKDTRENLLYCERADFLDRTELTVDIELSEVGQYDRLIEQITQHQKHLQQTAKEEVSFANAARDWHGTIYRPLCDIILRGSLIDSFPKRTISDLYAYITYHQWSSFRQRLHDIGIDKIIPKEMEAFRKKMADLKSVEYPEMKIEITAFILMSVQAKKEYKLIDKLYAIDEVKEVHSIHGDVDILVKIELARDLLISDAEVIAQFVHDNIRQLTGVNSTKTLIPGLSKIKS
jgi:DNA-binding Lrp family transcriptional regulator/uncharacterized ParB-like nuclease family protein